jgi:long-chain acyl-CoA synthetase
VVFGLVSHDPAGCGHNVMKGYWSLPEATADAVVSEWFSTGDIGQVDEEGYFYIVVRKKI